MSPCQSKGRLTISISIAMRVSEANTRKKKLSEPSFEDNCASKGAIWVSISTGHTLKGGTDINCQGLVVL